MYDDWRRKNMSISEESVRRVMVANVRKAAAHAEHCKNETRVAERELKRRIKYALTYGVTKEELEQIPNIENSVKIVSVFDSPEAERERVRQD